MDAPWQIQADKIQYNEELGIYEAVGNVVVSRQGRTLSADMVQLNQISQDALAIGNVRLISEKDILRGRRLRMNLESETGELSGGSVFIHQNHFYLSGDLIRKTGVQTYTADRFTGTTCDGPDPDWKITGRDLKVTIEGYGFSKHATLWAGIVPVLYSPYLIFPVKLKRQSGLLIPEIGYSQRKGNQYLQPLFWAINEHSDATLFAHYMSERGTRMGIEYRYILSDRSQGAFMAEGFSDRQVDDGSQQASEQWGYEDDDAARPNDDRYWVRMKHDQQLPGGLTAKLDLDVVSDQDYLYEFRKGYNGFDVTRDYFRNTYGRDIDDESEAIRLNRLNLNRTWHHYAFNTDLRWYDDVVRRRQNMDDNTVHQLPAIMLGATQQPVGNWPIYYDLESSYVHFYRINGTRGQRLDLYPRVYAPFELARSIVMAPSVGVRATTWRLNYDDEAQDNEKDYFSRSLYDVKLDTSTELYRLYNVSWAGHDKLKHAVTPQVVYEFIPEEDQEDLPEFDDNDRIEAKNLVTYSLTNTFTGRRPNQTRSGQTSYSYQTYLRLKLAQSFDIDKQNNDDPEPFSDVAIELDVTPGRYVRLDTDAGWSVYDDQLTTFTTTLKLWDNRGDKLDIDYSYQRESDPGDNDGLESIGVSGELKLTNRLGLQGAYERNLNNQQAIESSFGISYQSQCWRVDFNYTVEDSDHSYSIMLNLLGLGSFSN